MQIKKYHKKYTTHYPSKTLTKHTTLYYITMPYVLITQENKKKLRKPQLLLNIKESTYLQHTITVNSQNNATTLTKNRKEIMI